MRTLIVNPYLNSVPLSLSIIESGSLPGWPGAISNYQADDLILISVGDDRVDSWPSISININSSQGEKIALLDTSSPTQWDSRGYRYVSCLIKLLSSSLSTLSVSSNGYDLKIRLVVVRPSRPINSILHTSSNVWGSYSPVTTFTHTPSQETNPHLYFVQHYNWTNSRASFNPYSGANMILFEDTASFNGMLTILDDNYLPTITSTSDNSALRNLAQSVIEFT